MEKKRSEKERARIRRYKASAKGIATRKKYQISERGIELSRIRAARYRALNKLKIRERNIRYHSSPKGKITHEKACRKYQKSPRGRFMTRLWDSTSKHKRRLSVVTSSQNIRLIRNLQRRWRAKKSILCFWCRSAFPSRLVHLDHIIPISKGGLHTIENICSSCPRCNVRKHAKDLPVWNRQLMEPVLL